MWNHFILENIHFAGNLLAALVTFAVAWLYFDAWTVKKAKKEGLRVIGFILLSLSFVFHASYVETTVLSSSLLGSNLQEYLFTLTRLPGYILIIISLILDPLQPKPTTTGLSELTSPKKSASAELAIPGISILASFKSLHLAYPFLCLTICLLYLRRATTGLERHLLTVALAFGLFTLFEFLSLASFLRGTDNVNLYNLVAPFGIIWIEEHIALLIATVILGKWAFAYLFKRIQTQLFMIITTTILAIFLITTVTFTGLLLQNLEHESLTKLETDVKVLGFAIESKKGEALSDAQVIALDGAVQQAIIENDRSTLNNIAEKFLLTKKQTSLLILSDTGVVLARGEDRERTGDSLSDDALIKRVLLGDSLTSATSKEGALAPQVLIQSATPIRMSVTSELTATPSASPGLTGQGKPHGQIVGAVVVSSAIDNAFVDGVKKATGLESSIYSGNILSATTISLDQDDSRIIGIREEDNRIKTAVLQNGESFTGSMTFLNTALFAAFSPLKDVDNVPVGMLSVGKPQVGVLQAAGRSIELTFLVTAVLLVLAIFPAYFIAKYIANQVR